MEYIKNNINKNEIFVANIYLFGMLKKTFYYKIDAEAIDIAGSIVRVSFGKKKTIGIVISVEKVDIKNNTINIHGDNFDVKKLKNIDEILYKKLISKNFLDFLKKMALYNIIKVERLLENVVFTPWLNKKKELKQLKIKKKNNVKNNIKLNDEQNDISNKISSVKNFNVHVLYGIMGSGKTYIFLDIIKRVLSEDKESQVLIMVPEIALTNNLVDVVYNFCGIEPIIWHSSISVSNKKIYYENIINGKIRIVISTRSGLLLPYKKLSIIVIDEEHDVSYKQDEIPVYNARDMAILRAKFENIPIILSSATPSIETFVNITNKKYLFYKINTQFFNIKPPKIEIINLLKEDNSNFHDNMKNKKNNTKNNETKYISKKARESIEETFKKKEQSMIFINRRGYSRTLKCADCGYEIKCKNCDNLLSYHKPEILKCHYCGFSITNLKNCYNCKSKNLIPSYGPGVEQIEEELHSFCKAKTLIFSSDEVRKNKDIDVISNKIKNGKVDVIIGTQILTKGYHFPLLTNIIILDIDRISLEGDFRVFEHMFQLLFQLSGRAGRERENSNVFIQTTNPENIVLKLLKNHDIKQFYLTEMEQRKKFNLPPFCRYISIIISSKDKNLALETSTLILKELRKKLSNNIKILGPTECNICFLKQNYRYRILIETDKKDYKTLTDIKDIYCNFDCKPNVLVKIDVDPYSFI